MRSDLRGRMTKLEGQMAYKSKKKNKKRHEANDFHVGDEVYVTSLSLAGTVSTLPNAKGDLYVQMGMMRSLVNIKDLEITKTAKDVKREIKEMKVVTEDVLRSTNPLPSDLRSMLWV